MEVLLQVGNIWKGWVMSPENILKKRVQGSRIISINLDGWPTFWLILMENVGKYTSPLDLLLHPCQAQIVFRSGAGLFKKHPIMGEKGSVEQHQNWYVEVDGLPLQGADWIEKHVFFVSIRDGEQKIHRKFMFQWSCRSLMIFLVVERNPLGPSMSSWLRLH